MKQMSLLEEPLAHGEERSVVLDVETEEALIVLMASALIAVVVAAEENTDDDGR